MGDPMNGGPVPTPLPSSLRRLTRLAPSVLDLGAYGASFHPLATPSGSAPAGMGQTCRPIKSRPHRQLYVEVETN